MSVNYTWSRPSLLSGTLRGQHVCPLPWKDGQDSAWLQGSEGRRPLWGDGVRDCLGSRRQASPVFCCCDFVCTSYVKVRET